MTRIDPVPRAGLRRATAATDAAPAPDRAPPSRAASHAAGALRFMAGSLAAAVLALAAGCGGSGSDADAPPPPVGDPVSATVGAAGGRVDFTASGMQGTLEFPAGALGADTVVTVTPVAPAEGEWGRLRISGVNALLETPATLTLTLPDGAALDASAALVVAGTDDQQVTLPAVVQTTARRVSVPIHWLGDGPKVAPLAARPNALPPFSPGELILLQRLAIRARVTAAELQYQALVATNNFSAAFNLAQSIVALQQSSGLDGFEEDARPWLNRTKDSACAVLRTQIAVARGTPIAAKDDFKRLTAPVMYWQAMVTKLGGEPCAGLDPAGAIDAKLTESLRWVEARTAGQPAPAQYPAIATPVRDGRGLMTEVTVLGTATVARSIDDGLVKPALAPVRAGAWATAGSNTQEHYRPALAAFGSGTPLDDDVQLARTTLQVASYRDAAATQVVGQATMGRQGTAQDSIRAWTVSAKTGGRVTLAGPIEVLRCPAAATERLVVEFEGHEVRNQPASGEWLLQDTSSFEVDRLLAAAGIAPATAAQHVLRVWRKGSSCNAAFGLADAAVAEITLDFGKACRPSPGSTHCATTIDVDGRPLQVWQARWLNKRGTVNFVTLRDARPVDFWVWRQGRATQLPADFAAVAMNNEDTLVGNAPMASPPNATVGWRSPAIWRPDGYTVLGLAGSLLAINDAGSAVGNANLICNDLLMAHGPSFGVALRVRNGAPTVAPPPAGWDADRCVAPAWSYLTSINNAGQECERRESGTTGTSADCAWINDGGRQAFRADGAGDLILTGGRALPGGAYGFVKLGNWHALDQNRQQVVDMRSGADMTVPSVSAASGLTAADVAPARWLWVDDLGGVLLQPSLHSGTMPGPAYVLTPAGVELP